MPINFLTRLWLEQGGVGSVNNCYVGPVWWSKFLVRLRFGSKIILPHLESISETYQGLL